MNRRQHWQEVLRAEMQRWSTLPHDQLLAQLRTTGAYEVEQGSHRYQIEIEALKITLDYIHVAISVDDGNIPASFVPATDSFITKTPGSKI